MNDVFAVKGKANDKISIITDLDGKQIVLINDIRFKSRRSIDWDEIEQILIKYIGKYYEIVETAEKVFKESQSYFLSNPKYYDIII